MTKQERRAVALLTPMEALPLLKGGGVDGGVQGRLEKGREAGGEEGGKAVVGM